MDLKQSEIKFWEEYAKIYFNLEKAKPYQRLTEAIENLVEPKKEETWLDLGCGPAKMSELIWKKSGGKVKEIVAADIILEPARERLSKINKPLPVSLRYVNLEKPLPFKNNCFDGAVANLVLPYIIQFDGKTGKEALEGVLKEVFRVLKPGGQFIWSTPIHNVNFVWVFLASIPDMLNPKDLIRIVQGIKILKHALQIQRRGYQGIYTFLPQKELQEILHKVGFVNPVWVKSFVGQVLVNRVDKPNQ